MRPLRSCRWKNEALPKSRIADDAPGDADRVGAVFELLAGLVAVTVLDTGGGVGGPEVVREGINAATA